MARRVLRGEQFSLVERQMWVEPLPLYRFTRSGRRLLFMVDNSPDLWLAALVSRGVAAGKIVEAAAGDFGALLSEWRVSPAQADDHGFENASSLDEVLNGLEGPVRLSVVPSPPVHFDRHDEHLVTTLVQFQRRAGRLDRIPAVLERFRQHSTDPELLAAVQRLDAEWAAALGEGRRLEVSAATGVFAELLAEAMGYSLGEMRELLRSLELGSPSNVQLDLPSKASAEKLADQAASLGAAAQLVCAE
jgi:hypothetical protein